MSIKLTYESLGSDGLAEITNRALAELCSNIGDPNTAPKAARELTIKVKLKPNEQRNFADLSYSVTAKAAPVKPVEITAMMDVDHASGEEVLFIPEIGTRPDQMELPVNVTKLPAKEAQNG